MAENCGSDHAGPFGASGRGAAAPCGPGETAPLRPSHETNDRAIRAEATSNDLKQFTPHV